MAYGSPVLQKPVLTPSGPGTSCHRISLGLQRSAPSGTVDVRADILSATAPRRLT